MPSHDSRSSSAPRSQGRNAQERGPRRSDETRRSDSPRRFDGPRRSDAPRRDNGPRQEQGDRSPLQKLTDIDRDIVRLIGIRTRMLASLPGGREATRAEKELRASWEAAASRISQDPRLIRQVFALLQQVECREWQPEGASGQEAFNLNPSRTPVALSAPGISDCRQTRIAGALAAATGSPMELDRVLLNDALVELVKAFNQINPRLRWEDSGRLVCVGENKSSGTDKSLLDRAVHVGDDMLNFLLLVCSMAVRPCRLKLMGDSSLKLADLSSLRHFLPALNARFTSIVPGQEGLPARLEASGILPERVAIPADLDYDAALCVCLALHCAPRAHGIRVDLDAHPQVDQLVAEMQEILALAHCAPQILDKALFLGPDSRPSFLMSPDTSLGMDLQVSCQALALPAFVGGRVELFGQGKDSSAWQACRALLEAGGLRLSATEQGHASSGEPLTSFDNARFAPYEVDFPAGLRPLAVLLPAAAAIKNGTAVLPECAVSDELDVVDEFLSRLHLEREGTTLRRAAEGVGTDAPWSAPSSQWGGALALAAFLRPNLQLINPGCVVKDLPAFWQWYNNLSRGGVPQRREAEQEAPAQPPRRRIRAGYMPEEHMPEALEQDED